MARAGVLSFFVLVCALLVGVMALEWDMRGLNAYTIPVMIWSDSLLFTPAHSQIVDTWTTKDVELTLSTLLYTPPFNKQPSPFDDMHSFKTSQSELVVLFMEPELSTDQITRAGYGGYFSNLKAAVEQAGSSLSVPYTTVAQVSLFDEALVYTVDSLTAASVILARMPNARDFSRLARNSNVKTVSVDDLVGTLQSSGVYSNRVTDLVIVCFDKDPTFASHDEIVKTVNDAVRAATKGNYVAVFSGNLPAASRVSWTFDQHAAEDLHYQQFVEDFGLLANGSGNGTGNTTNSTSINFFPGPLIEVYLITAVLLAMVFTGACAIFSLQTPDRWDAPKVKRDAY